MPTRPGPLKSNFLAVPNANGVVNSLAMQADGKMLIGGSFTTVGGVPRNHIARLNADRPPHTLSPLHIQGQLDPAPSKAIS